MSSDLSYFQSPCNTIDHPPMLIINCCQVNGVPSPQSLGHILSEDVELNEISDELPQVVFVVNISQC